MKKSIAILNYVLIGLIVFFFCSLNYVAYYFNGIITSAICGTGINLNQDGMNEATKEGTKLAAAISGDGITMLKNQNDALPLKKGTDDEIKLNVFGKDGADTCFIYQGYGSGGGSREASAQVSLYTALRQAGISINEDLATDYNALTPVRDRGIVSNDMNIFEAPNDFYSDDRIQTAKNFSGNALIVLGRCLGEGYDAPMSQTVNGVTTTDRHYLQLSKEEEYMIQKVEENFDNVIVVLNSTNLMECGFIQNEAIDAALTMYAPGNSGSVALGQILTGEINPSGRTVDTWAYDFKSDATYPNSGVNGSHANNTNGYVDYAENIYEGYYWFETADEEGYFADVSNDYGTGYQGVVQYPFGYGLSYTTFQWTLEETSLADKGVINGTDKITYKVFVENTGTVAGKDVVELYYTLPYTKGGIEKPSIRLGAFAKTALLNPGEGEELTLTLDPYQMASYDVYDKNNNGFMGYELEKGTYQVSLRSDVHTLKETETSGMDQSTLTYTVSDDLRYENDPVTGYPVVNRFTTYTNETSGATSKYEEKSMSADSYAYSIDGSDAGCDISYMTREDFKGTYPETKAVRQMSDEFVKKSFNINSPRINSEDTMPVTGSKETSYTINDVLGLDYSDPIWDSLVSQLSVNQMASLCANGGWGTASIPSISKPYCSHSDGTSGFNRAIASMETGYATNYPCAPLIASTWNWKMAYQFGSSVGSEAQAADIQGWYGPACDTHRSPFGGRNFEYYSEDPLIGGTMVSYTVKGAQEKGLYCFLKHFAGAETEPDRSGKYTWMSEQAAREIYLKPFEYAVKLGGTTAIMTAYNRLGGTRCSGSYALLTEVLRNEWGFHGCVISDYFCGGNAMDEDEFIRAGNDLKLFPGGKASDFNDLSSATAVKALQKSTKNILYSYVQTRYINVTAEGLDMSSAIGTKSEVYPWWIWILGTIDFVVLAGGATWAILVTIKLKKKQTPVKA